MPTAANDRDRQAVMSFADQSRGIRSGCDRGPRICAAVVICSRFALLGRGHTVQRRSLRRIER
jgi:hypothetical protein